MTTELFKQWLAAVFTWTIVWQLSASSQTPQNFQRVLIIKQARHLGEWAAVSADGTTMVYVGADGGLHLLKIASREDHVLLMEAGGFDVFSNPSFAPDGMRVAVSASGGPWHHASEIYSVRTDGTDLRQLTVSRPSEGHPPFSEYFSTPMYSPDGSQILIWRENSDLSSPQPASAELM